MYSYSFKLQRIILLLIIFTTAIKALFAQNQWPLKQGNIDIIQVVSSYGNPTNGKGGIDHSFHQGLDVYYDNFAGNKIYAMRAGSVRYVFQKTNSATKGMIAVQLNNGAYDIYLHFERFSDYINDSLPAPLPLNGVLSRPIPVPAGTELGTVDYLYDTDPRFQDK